MKRTPLSRALRDFILSRDGLTCRYCGLWDVSGQILSVDHVLPVSAGGDNRRDNLVTACWNCNRLKGKKLDVLQPIPLETLHKYQWDWRDGWAQYTMWNEEGTILRRFYARQEVETP